MASKLVLIADDDSHIRRVLGLKLEKNGYRTLMAKDGQQAFKIIQEKLPDVVITDINMPKMDGKRLSIKCGAFKKERSFLTIVVTARIEPRDREWVGILPDTILMEKPFSPTEIVNAIKTYFGEGA